MSVVNRANRKEGGHRRPSVRPRRGTPAETRERLVAAAASIFNRFGYHGTDSNRIAQEAGYAAGTFYKHFRNKREIFLAAYDGWITSQWKEVEAELGRGLALEETARNLVELSIGFHSRWKGLRASLMELVFADPEVRRFYRKQRRRQLRVIAELRQRFAIRKDRQEEDAIHLYTTERVYDAMGQGEIAALGLDRQRIVEAMVAHVLTLLGKPRG